jgi:hypothetical protein
MRVLTMPRDGRSESENEDACGCNASHGLAVLSDGATAGAFSGPWARLLVESCVAERLDPADPVRFHHWLNERRRAWLDAVRFAELPRPELLRVEETGAGATLLSWQLGRFSDGTLAWRAWAIGDSCLFWVRGNRLRASFPLAHSNHFALAPELLSSWPLTAEPAPLFGAGVCQPGDLFVLASDALARYLLARVERGKEPDWNHLETIPEDDWRKRLRSLRDRERLANDDCTLVLARAQH